MMTLFIAVGILLATYEILILLMSIFNYGELELALFQTEEDEKKGKYFDMGILWNLYTIWIVLGAVWIDWQLFVPFLVYVIVANGFFQIKKHQIGCFFDALISLVWISIILFVLITIEPQDLNIFNDVSTMYYETFG